MRHHEKRGHDNAPRFGICANAASRFGPPSLTPRPAPSALRSVEDAGDLEVQIPCRDRPAARRADSPHMSAVLTVTPPGPTLLRWFRRSSAGPSRRKSCGRPRDRARTLPVEEGGSTRTSSTFFLRCMSTPERGHASGTVSTRRLPGRRRCSLTLAPQPLRRRIPARRREDISDSGRPGACRERYQPGPQLGYQCCRATSQKKARMRLAAPGLSGRIAVSSATLP
jgi:hypothetical protein